MAWRGILGRVPGWFPSTLVWLEQSCEQAGREGVHGSMAEHSGLSEDEGCC